MQPSPILFTPSSIALEALWHAQVLALAALVALSREADSGRFTAKERASRAREDVAKTFHLFARNEAPQLDSPLYAELCYGISADTELIDLARRTPPDQPPPNMLLAAVQYLLLRGAEHALRAHYPAITGEPRPLDAAFPLFRDFVLAHADEITPLVRSRRTQTNVVRRCTCLLPAFAAVHAEARKPLALIDLGASAGLNLNFDRYRYAYQSGGRDVTLWGDPASPVALSAELRGETALPLLPQELPVAQRHGIDLSPIELSDEDALLWLRALIWPEHVERHTRLLAAADIARAHPVHVRKGNAVSELPAILAEVSADAAPVVYATHALYQITRDDVARIVAALQTHAAERPVWLIGLEGTGPRYSELALVRFEGSARAARKIANASPHGWWLEWLSGAATEPTRDNSRWLHWLATHRG